MKVMKSLSVRHFQVQIEKREATAPMMNLSRRRFLRDSVAGTMAAAGSLDASLHCPCRIRNRLRAATRTVPTFCNLCFWECGAIATVRDGKVMEIEGNPLDPLSRGTSLPARHRRDRSALSIPTVFVLRFLRVSERGEEKWKAVDLG